MQIYYFCTLDTILNELRELLFKLLGEIHCRNSNSHNLGLVNGTLQMIFHPYWIKGKEREQIMIDLDDMMVRMLDWKKKYFNMYYLII